MFLDDVMRDFLVHDLSDDGWRGGLDDSNGCACINETVVSDCATNYICAEVSNWVPTISPDWVRRWHVTSIKWIQVSYHNVLLEMKMGQPREPAHLIYILVIR